MNGHQGMKATIDIPFDDRTVRFTVDGKMYVIDAISTLVETASAIDVWKYFKKEKPEIAQYIKYHYLLGNLKIPITDSAGWEKIQILLLNYLIDSTSFSLIQLRLNPNLKLTEIMEYCPLCLGS
ncbi:hypothetical protein [Desulfocicer niacini]